ncbi:MAG TPA: SRPBCC family protein [Rhizomicrobium sp.]|jgi:uncharacterized protein YndB with AHSA1/START domain
MTTSSYVYVSYIRTTQERLWSALTNPEIMKQYWFGMHQDCEWKPGASWRMVFSDGRVADAGTILEIDPPRRMVIEWRNEFRPELKEEGPARCTIELEPLDDTVKLTIVHAIGRAESKFIAAVSTGWPKIISNLKSLLETGSVILRDNPKT